MSLTITNKEFSVFGTKRVVFCDIAFDASYPTGGESLTPSDLGLSEAKFVSIAGNSGYIFEYDYTNKKLKAMTPTAKQAVAATGANQPDVSSGSATASAVDTTTPTVTVPAGFRSEVDAAPADEAGNTTNLSAVTAVKLMMIGR
jgi:hypothetical protein